MGLFHDLNTDNSAKAVVFAIHYSGGLQNQTASALTTNYGAVSQPRFILNGVDQNVLSIQLLLPGSLSRKK